MWRGSALRMDHIHVCVSMDEKATVTLENNLAIKNRGAVYSIAV